PRVRPGLEPAARRRAPPRRPLRRALPRRPRPVRDPARDRSAAERPPQRLVGGLAGAALDEPPPQAARVRLRRSVPAHVDPAAKPRRPRDLAAHGDLRDRLVLLRQAALGPAPLPANEPVQARLERDERLVERGE